MSSPVVPPRPQRKQGGPTAVENATPLVPPRPTIRKTDPSPDREAYTRSPLNFHPSAIGNSKPRVVSARSSQELPRRPPSVSLPSIGQEGSEYSSYDQLPAEVHGMADTNGALSQDGGEKTKSVAADVFIHQPIASVPISTAKKQIQTVTRTDSTQAAAAGIGKAAPADDVHRPPQRDTDSPLGRSVTASAAEQYRRPPSAELHPLRAKSSFSRSNPNLHHIERVSSRPSSIYGVSEHELGIPEIGMQIPLYPNAGDVQAPSPAPNHSQHVPGIGFFNDGTTRAHQRKRSSRQEFGPPGSYGIHHDADHQDQFEKAWIVKHPDEAAKEGYYLHRPKPETALTSEQLNRLVGQNDVGMGTTPDAISTPAEDIAFDATDEYLSRMSSKRTSPVPTTDRKKRASSGSMTESQLRRTSYPWNDINRNRSDQAMESDDENVYHIQPSTTRANKITGGGEADNKMDLGPHPSEEGGWINEHGDGAPILASDEVVKRPGSAFMHAAVTPDHPDDLYDEYGYYARRNSSQPPSRPGSVHGGYHGGPIHRIVSHDEPQHSGLHTPLGGIEEYEPLFPDDEKENTEKLRRPLSRRVELAQHHFPSRDIWEDTPASLQYSTTVSTPEMERKLELVEASQSDLQSISKTFETPETEQARRDGTLDSMASGHMTSPKRHLKPGVAEELRDRPGPQRFPSSDIWEDTPDSMRLVTTVSAPQMDEIKSPPDDRETTGSSRPVRPTIPTRPERKSKLAQEVKPEKVTDEEESREVKSPTKGPAPSIPDKPKPTIPARPARATQQSDQTAREADATPPAVPKTKPLVPARPGGEKIAALKAGFGSNLNNLLKLGPQGPPPKKEPEAEVAEETEKAPLADARKSRARGPARRKPGPLSAPETKSSSATFAMSPLVTMWSIDEEDELQVQQSGGDKAEHEGEEDEEDESKPADVQHQKAEEALAANEASHTLEPPMAPPQSNPGTASAHDDEADVSKSEPPAVSTEEAKTALPTETSEESSADAISAPQQEQPSVEDEPSKEVPLVSNSTQGDSIDDHPTAKTSSSEPIENTPAHAEVETSKTEAVDSEEVNDNSA